MDPRKPCAVNSDSRNNIIRTMAYSTSISNFFCRLFLICIPTRSHCNPCAPITNDPPISVIAAGFRRTRNIAIMHNAVPAVIVSES